MDSGLCFEALEDLGYHCLWFTFRDDSLGHCCLKYNAPSGARECSPEMLDKLVQACISCQFPKTFLFPLEDFTKIEVRSSKCEQSCLLFWKDGPPSGAHSAAAAESEDEYLRLFIHHSQQVVAPFPAFFCIIRVVKDEKGQDDGEYLAVSDMLGRALYGCEGRQVVGRRGARDLNADNMSYLDFWRSSRQAQDRVSRRRFEIASDTTGSVSLHELVVAPLDIPGCPSVEAYVMIGHDVTDAVREVRESEQRLRTILDHIPAMAFESDAQHRALWLNKEWYEATGQTKEQSLGHGWKECAVGDWVHRGMEPPPRHTVLETQMRLKDGKVHDFLTRVVPMLKSNGEVFYIGTNTDITAQKEIERKLVAANEHLESASKLKTTFISRISHEIRTPLHAIINLLQFLWDSELDPEQKDFVLTCIQSSNLLLSLLDDCLDLSKIEAGKLTITSENFDVRTLVLGCVEMFCGTAASKGLQLWCTVSPRVPNAAKGSPTRMRQILNNLISNACKYTPSGSIVVNVDVGPDPSSATVEVRDTGFGLTEVQRDKLFQPFSQVLGPNQTANGTGLGLSISQQLAVLMGGSITVSENTPRGCIFSLTLPIFEAAPTAHQPPPPATPAPNILIIMADAVGRESLSTLLSHKYRVEAHASVEECVGDGREWDIVVWSHDATQAQAQEGPLPTTIQTATCISLQPSPAHVPPTDLPTANPRFVGLPPAECTVHSPSNQAPAVWYQQYSLFPNAEHHTVPLPLKPLRLLDLVHSVLNGSKEEQAASSRRGSGSSSSSGVRRSSLCPALSEATLTTCPPSWSSKATTSFQTQPDAPSPPELREPEVLFSPVASAMPLQCTPTHFPKPLSRDRSSRAQDAQAATEMSPSSQCAGTACRRVLIAEDNFVNQKVIRKLCEGAGFVPHIVGDGRECVDTWAQSPAGTYSLILMDVGMPSMDGITATREIRRMEAERPNQPPIPIIALTASAMADSVSACFDAGMDAFLSKPIRPQVLSDTLRPFL